VAAKSLSKYRAFSAAPGLGRGGRGDELRFELLSTFAQGFLVRLDLHNQTLILSCLLGRHTGVPIKLDGPVRPGLTRTVDLPAGITSIAASSFLGGLQIARINGDNLSREHSREAGGQGNHGRHAPIGDEG
jgi:hypothetical protein